MARILLADDSAHAQRMGTKILSAEGHEVTAVSNGQAALKTLKNFTPDLVVADVFMPGKTGYEVCQFIKSDPKLRRIPVVLIVGKMEPYDPTEGQRVHADGVVTKPLEASNLVAIVEQLLKSAKKSAPPPPAPQPKAPAEPEPEPEAQEDMAAPITTPIPPPTELEIPEEMRQQPVSLIGDLHEPPAAPAAAEEVAGLAAEASILEAGPAEAVPGEQPAAAEVEPLFPVSEAESAGIGEALTAVLATSGGEESAPAAPSSWTAESAAVTEDDKKLFDPQPPDWQGLVSMVQEADEHPQQPATLAAGMGMMGSPPDVESAAGLSAAPVASAEREFSTPQTLLRPERTTNSESAEGIMSSPPLQEKSVSPADSVELPAPKIAPLDYATVEQIVRETVEELMPEIVDRIAKATGISFEKKG